LGLKKCRRNALVVRVRQNAGESLTNVLVEKTRNLAGQHTTVVAVGQRTN